MTMDVTAVGSPEVVRELARRVDARRAAETEEAIVEPIPAPRVVARATTTEELASCPSAARALKAALAAGWDQAHVTYAHGPVIDSTGTKVLAWAESLVLRIPPHAYAAWLKRDDGKMKWEFDGAALRSPATALKSTEFAHWVASLGAEHRHTCDGDPCRRSPWDGAVHGAALDESCHCGHTDATACAAERRPKKKETSS